MSHVAAAWPSRSSHVTTAVTSRFDVTVRLSFGAVVGQVGTADRVVRLPGAALLFERVLHILIVVQRTTDGFDNVLLKWRPIGGAVTTLRTNENRQYHKMTS